jgi:hypothetical protein
MTAFVAGRAALELHGVRNLRNLAIEILITGDRKLERAPKWVIVHRTSHLPKPEVQRHGATPCTSPERSMVDAAQWASSDHEARLVIAMAFQQRIVGLSAVDQVLAGMPMIRRQALIARTVADAAGGAHSLAELEFLRLSRSAGLPGVVGARASGRRDRTCAGSADCGGLKRTYFSLMSFSGNGCRMFGGAFHFWVVSPVQVRTTSLLIWLPLA